MKRAIFIVGCLALSLSACTAIVLGKLSDTKGYTAPDGASVGSSGNPGGGDDDGSIPACSLLPNDIEPGTTLPENPCSTCIESSCAAELTYACNGGGENEKDWFHTLEGCAQRPYNGFSPPEAGALGDSWGCTNYEDSGAPIIDNGSDAQHKQAAAICVDQNCMRGNLPACNQCVVSTTKTGTDELSYLNSDPCGRCFTDKCQEHIVACCNTSLVKDVLSACAFTQDTTTNKKTCMQFGDPQALDGGSGSLAFTYSGPCLNDFVDCYNTYCKDTTNYSCERTP